MKTNNNLEYSLNKIEEQKTLFALNLRRSELLQLRREVENQTEMKLRVHRNQPIEYILSALPSFLAYSDLSLTNIISDYDDSLSFQLTSEKVDVELIWLDFERYLLNTSELLEWLYSRIVFLREKTNTPILIASWASIERKASEFNKQLVDKIKTIADVKILSIDEIRKELGEEYIDTRFSKIGATKLSEKANLQIARLLGLCWLPAVLKPRLKALVLDLDHTLWGGVLGEDGLKGVIIDDAYQSLHKEIINLSESGLMIGVLSRNEMSDVKEIFDTSVLKPLKERITAFSVSWGSKAIGMKIIAEKFRISYDSILFVDDNPGELALVAEACQGVQLLLACPDPIDTVRALKYYPNLFSFNIKTEDALRSYDLQKNIDRETLEQTSLNKTEYLKSLNLNLTLALNAKEQIGRIAELSNKTNQFNLVLARMNETEASTYFQNTRKAVVSISLKDRFSDSGLIGIVFFELKEDLSVIISELCISCRALGRGVEDAMLFSAINLGVSHFKELKNQTTIDLKFKYSLGERNKPALDWLRKLSKQELNSDGCIDFVYDRVKQDKFLQELPIAIVNRSDDESGRYEK